MNFLPSLIAAMVMVESGGEARAIGDNGRALGCLQIHQEVIRDVNEIYGKKFKHGDAFQPKKARQICRLYLAAYAPKNARPEQLARIWNGGPCGHLKAETQGYWKKVKAELKKQTSNIQHQAPPKRFAQASRTSNIQGKKGGK